MNNKYRSPLHEKQEVSNTVRRLETAFYVLTFYVSPAYMYFYLSNFSDTVYQLIVMKR